MPQLKGASHASSYARQPISSHMPCQRRSAFQRNEWNHQWRWGPVGILGNLSITMGRAVAEMLICHFKSPQTSKKTARQCGNTPIRWDLQKKNEIPITYIYIYLSLSPVIILLFLDLGSICGLGFPAANSYSPPEKDKASLPPKYLPLSTHFGALVAATQPHRPLLRPAWVARDRERRGPANCSPWGSYGSKCH